MAHVALLTCRPLPEPDPDEAPVLAALRAIGVRAEARVWDDPALRPDAYDALVLRATWDYAAKHRAFRAWIDRPDVASRLWNPPEIVRWNLHKGYLLELESRGVPVVPTRLIGAGDDAPAETAEAIRASGWASVVVKPAVSAGSARTRLFEAGEADRAAAFVGDWPADADVLVQPYLRSVEGDGHGAPERAIVWIDGAVSHVIEKGRRFAGDEEAVRAVEPREEDAAFASRAVGASGFDPLYARVDVMQDDAGRTVLSELELIEPSLYVDLGPGSAERFARAIASRLG